MPTGFLTKPFHSIRDLVARVSDLFGPGTDCRKAVPVETSDIDNLYEKSFAETAEIEEFDTVDDLLGDSGMDDEMIEASYPAESAGGNVAEFAAAIDNGETVKAFDWSPESIITETEPAETPAAGSFDPKFVIEKASESETHPESEPQILETAQLEESSPVNDGNPQEPSSGIHFACCPKE